MRSWHPIFGWLLGLGGPGLLLVGVLDSSYLSAPGANDLLLIALVTHHPDTMHMLLLAAISAVGSVLGCLLLDLTTRPLGEKGLEKFLPPRRIKSVRLKVGRNAGRALVVASLAPPPFPFTAFVMAASALQYSRTRFIAIIGAARLVRFLIVGVLAQQFGRKILDWADLPVVQGLLIGLIVLCTVGSIVPVYGWITHRRATRP